jgi:hypothetical protein
LFQSLQKQRESELRAELTEARDFQRAGLDFAAVQAARRAAAGESLQRASELRRGSGYQLSLPGVNPTLMALRSPLLGPQEMAAAGVMGYQGWQRSTEPAGQQLELDLSGRSAAANAVVPLSRLAPGGNGGRPPVAPPASPIAMPPGPTKAGALRLAGDRLPGLLAAVFSGAGVATGSWLSWDDGGTQL